MAEDKPKVRDADAKPAARQKATSDDGFKDEGAAKVTPETEQEQAESDNTGQRIIDANTATEQATIDRNQARYDARTSGKTSAEVNEMEAKQAAKADNLR
jgi:hypothetical protein